jgi:hypothetical protein
MSGPPSVNEAPAFREYDQPLKLRLPLGLAPRNAVAIKLPESLNPMTALRPHQATVVSLCTLPASRLAKSSSANGSLPSPAGSCSAGKACVPDRALRGCAWSAASASCSRLSRTVRSWAPPADKIRSIRSRTLGRSRSRFLSILDRAWNCLSSDDCGAEAATVRESAGTASATATANRTHTTGHVRGLRHLSPAAWRHALAPTPNANRLCG